MNVINPSENRYRPLRTNFTDTHPLVIDTEAKAEDIQSAAHQRIRAATDLLETFSCLTFEHADVKDISHIINALYLLVQDGCDLLEATQHVQLQPAAGHPTQTGQAHS